MHPEGQSQKPNRNMSSVQAFTNSLIDFAGLFPPASLSLPDAMNDFNRHCLEEHGGVLARFVFPAKHVQFLESFIKETNQKHGTHQPLHISLLVDAAETSDDVLRELETHLSLWSKLTSDRSFHVTIDCIETSLPKALLQEKVGRQKEFVNSLENLLARHLPTTAHIPFFIEFPWTESSEFPLDLRLNLHIDLLSERKDRRFAKLRTGGTTPAQIPPTDKLAMAIHAFASAKIPMKFTAGLHQPLFHMDKQVGAFLYGFQNVFFAAFGAALKGWTHAQIGECLETPDADFWRWEDQEVACFSDKLSLKRDLRTKADKLSFTLNEIMFARQKVALSFGSCSFSEPIQALQEKALLS